MNYKEQTKKAYNLNSQEYIKKYKNNSNFERREEFQLFIDNLKGDKILDVGCGPGFHTQYFNSQGLGCLGIDNSEEMISYAKSNDINVELMDIENLTFEKNSFDGIWCVSSFFHIEKELVPKIINSFFNILAKNGIIYFSLKEGNGEEIDKDGRYFAYYQKEEFLDLIGNKFELVWEKEELVTGVNNIGLLLMKNYK